MLYCIYFSRLLCVVFVSSSKLKLLKIPLECFVLLSLEWKVLGIHRQVSYGWKVPTTPEPSCMITPRLRVPWALCWVQLEMPSSGLR